MQGFPDSNLTTPESSAAFQAWCAPRRIQCSAHTLLSRTGARYRHLCILCQPAEHGHRKDSSCQPNFRRNVSPDPATHCGPYAPAPDPGVAAAQPLAPGAALPAPQAPAGAAPQAQAAAAQPGAPAAQAPPQAQPPLLWGLRRRMHAASAGGGRAGPNGLGPRSHDTIAMVAVDASGRFAAGASTNGMTHKARHSVLNHWALCGRAPGSQQCPMACGSCLRLSKVASVSA